MIPEKPPNPIPEGEKDFEKKVPETVETRITAELFGSRNKSFFEKMSEGGKRIINEAYACLYKTPVINRIVGKLEIAYNQFWADKYQKKAAEYKEKLDSFNLRIEALDQYKKEIESLIEDFEKENLPGSESLKLKIQKIDREKEKLLNKKDKVHSKFEAQENKMKIYINERDRIADKLINYYEEKLKPMEKELEQLQTLRDQIDLEVAIANAKQKECLEKITDLEKRKNQIEKALRTAGYSEREIKRKIKKVERSWKKLIAFNQEKIKKLQKNIEKCAGRISKIDKRIAKVNAKANPYREKREEFVRIKERRPIYDEDSS